MLRILQYMCVTSLPKKAPESIVDRSHGERQGVALRPPTGATNPSSAACASVVGSPSRLTAQSGGTARPSLAATMILPAGRAKEHAMSRTIGAVAQGQGNRKRVVAQHGF